MSVIDLSRRPPPEAIEQIEVSAIRQELNAAVVTRWPEIADNLNDPSDPVVKILDAVAVYTVLERARANDQARGTMLAYAFGATLENLGALLGVARLVVDPGDAQALPPRPATFESDDALRSRIQASLEGFTTCGPVQAYAFHARSADGRITDVTVVSPAPGEVLVTIAAMELDGTVTAAPVDAVTVALNDDEVRPLCDSVTVRAASGLTYDIEAVVEIAVGPDAGLVLAEAEARLRAAAARIRLIGRDVSVSAIYAALHGPSVEGVRLVTPVADVPVAEDEFPILGAITLTLGTVIG